MKPVLGLAILFLPVIAFADQHSTAGVSSKSLSQQEIMALKAGKGMGMAKVAELNQYPGPRHVLELADELGLTDEQLAQSQVLFADVKTRSIALGNEIIAAEQALESAFAEGSVEADSVNASVLEIGRLRAELRYVHVEAHLKQREVLSEQQVAQYDAARSMARGKHGQGGKGHGKKGQGKMGQGKMGEGKHGQGKKGQGKHQHGASRSS